MPGDLQRFVSRAVGLHSSHLRNLGWISVDLILKSRSQQSGDPNGRHALVDLFGYPKGSFNEVAHSHSVAVPHPRKTPSLLHLHVLDFFKKDVPVYPGPNRFHISDGHKEEEVQS